MKKCQVNRLTPPGVSYESLGRDYIRNASERPLWWGALQGMADTHTRRTVREGDDFYRELIEFVPTPESARAKCRPLRRGLDPSRETWREWQDRFEKAGFPSIPDRGMKNLALSVCHTAENWDQVSDALRRCDRDDAREALIQRRTTKSPGSPFLHATGFNVKGVDMMLLDVGCQLPVADKHMIELIEGRPITEDEAKTIQMDHNKYEKYWGKLTSMAEDSGKPHGVWHVETWTRKAFGPGNEDRAQGLFRGYGLTD